MATYEEIKKANAEIRTTDIRGKQYADVAERVNAFRKVYPHGSIRTEMAENEGTPGKRVCVFRAVVSVGEVILGTGTAYEIENAGNINRTSYIENCETSAVGRALGFAGFGIAGGIASAEEVQRAQEAQQSAQGARRRTGTPAEVKQAGRVNETQVKRLEELIKRNGLSLPALLKSYRVTALADLTPEQYDEITAKTQAWAARNMAAAAAQTTKEEEE